MVEMKNNNNNWNYRDDNGNTSKLDGVICNLIFLNLERSHDSSWSLLDKDALHFQRNGDSTF